MIFDRLDQTDRTCLLVALACFSYVECRRATSPDAGPLPDASTPTEIQAICLKLADAGCPEGNAGCVDRLARESRLTHLPETACLLDAGSPTDVARCGAGHDDTTIRFRCGTR